MPLITNKLNPKFRLVGIPLVILAACRWRMATQTPVPLPQLRQDAPLRFSAIELQAIHARREKKLSFAWYEASRDRYKHHLPFAYNQVPHTNGSQISYEGRICYHAHCAPLKWNYFEYFSQILEGRIPLVVTLTPFAEGKAEDFLIHETYGDLVVRPGHPQLRSLSSFSAVETTVSLQRHEQAHTFTHLHITNWGDMQAGDSDSIIALLDRVDELRALSPLLPFVVQCSAGVGRTGVFLVSHQIKRKIEAGLPYGVNQLLLDTRLQRAGCVQKEEQYFILFEVADQLEKRAGRTLTAPLNSGSAPQES